MKQLNILLILVFLVVLACEPKLKPEQPQNLIPKDQMAMVLYDMFIVNSAKGINRKTLEDNSLNPQRYILEKHNIDSLQFVKSNNYYAHEIEVYNELIEKVKDKITVEKEKYEAIQKKEEIKNKVIKDSLKRSTKKTPVSDRSVDRGKK